MRLPGIKDWIFAAIVDASVRSVTSFYWQKQQIHRRPSMGEGVRDDVRDLPAQGVRLVDLFAHKPRCLLEQMRCAADCSSRNSSSCTAEARKQTLCCALVSCVIPCLQEQ